MKKKLSKLVTGIFSFVAAAGLFVSCENFLDGGNLKDQINEQIEYAALPSRTVRITGDSDLVTFLSGSGDKSLKTGAAYTVECSVKNSSYRFAGWKITEKNNTSVDASSYVEYKTKIEDNQIVMNFTMKPACPDLVISPVITLKPAVESYSAQNADNGISYLAPVRIKFTQPVQSECAVMDNIKIIDDTGKNVSGAYRIERLSEDGLYLTIAPDVTKMTGYFSGKTTLTVTMSDAMKERFEPFAAFENQSFSFIIDDILDEADPVFLSQEVYKQKHYLKENGYTKIDAKDFALWTNEDYSLFNVRDRIVIKNITASDEGSGIKALCIQETVAKTDVQNGAENTKTEIFEYSDYDDNDGTAVFKDFEYVLKSSSDGIIKVDLWMEDWTGRKSEHIFYYVLKFAGGINTLKLNTGNTKLRFSNENGKDIITNKEITSIECYEKVFGDITIPVKVKLTAKDESSDEETVLFETDNLNQQGEYNFSDELRLERNPYVKTTITLYAEDSFGYSRKQDYIIPPAVLPNPVYSWGDIIFPYNANVNFYRQKTNSTYSGWYEVEYDVDYQCPFIYESTIKNVNEMEFCCITKEDFYSCAALTIRVKKGSSGFTPVTGNTGSYTYPEIELTTANPGPNKGYHDVKVNYLTPGDSNYKYVLFSEKDGEKIFYHEDNFQLYSEGRSEIKIARLDQYNFILGTSDVEIKKTYVLDLEDNVPPVPDFYDWGYWGGIEVYDLEMTNSGYNTISFTLHKPYTDKSGLEKDPVTGEYILHYYYVKDTLDNVKEEYSDEKLKEDQSGKLYFTESLNRSITLNVKEPGYYTFFVKIYDTKGNYYLQSTEFCTYIDSELPDSINYDSSTKKLSVSYKDTAGKRWNVTKLVKNDSSWNWEYFTSTGGTNFQGTITDTATFYKIDACTTKNGLRNYKASVYVYPEFFKGTHTVENKNLMELPYGYQLFIDQPALVQVYYDYIDNGENAGLWSTRGQAIPIKVVGKLDTNASYTINIDEDSLEIPSGMYYCTIIHFADGSTIKLPTKVR